VPVSVNIAPVIPGLTDTEIPTMLEAVADAGARRVAWVLLRLPYQVKDLFLDWMQRELHPDRARKVESLIRQARGGKLYDAGQRARYRLDDNTSKMVAQRPTARDKLHARQETERAADGWPTGHDRRRGAGAHAVQLKEMFDIYCRKYGLNRDVRPLSTRAFRRPSRHGQMGLFG